MTTDEHLLLILSEECDEVGQRVSKALRFGLSECQPGQSKTNAERITEELDDLLGIMQMLIERGLIPTPSEKGVISKKAKIGKYLQYAEHGCGTIGDK
jgi:hypothetical protein